MSEADRKRLRGIQTFPALVKYLREDLRWPVEQDNFDDIDDLTFDWDAEELGIDPKQAAKIEYVKQLRPLENGQPQGVFFVKFDTRQLPVVAMRKLLQTLVIKKRASAKGADRPMWEMRNLVFISSYGDRTERQLSFAYFQEPDAKDERPALKVLGWDDTDTPLHLDRVHELLQSHLTWPQTSKELPAWRARWSAAFQVGHGEPIRTAKDLAGELAALARRIRERAKQLLKIETNKGPLRSLMVAFKKALIHDLTDEQFADMYAQTIAYGLLSARITHPDPVKAETLPDLIPVTNPFLKELMETFVAAGGKHPGARRAHHVDFDELGINDVVDLLRRANMDAVLRDFGAEDRKEDPVLYFYEGFAKAYDPAERIRRGEFYTPLPVVRYIVRSVHEVLQSEFHIEDGLASTITWGEMIRRHIGLQVPQGVTADTPFVQILDPATGTGTFLVEVIDVILATLKARWSKQGLPHARQAETWNAYVTESLLPRLHGYELKMAPYAIAHVKIGLKLFATGYRFGGRERARIYLTNALEPATDASDSQIDALSGALAHEAQAVNRIKQTQRFTVVIANPPYSNFGQLNRNSFILELIADYKRDLGERKLNLDDDFIKFVRFSHHLLELSRVGVLGIITNNVFIDGITHRRMRESLKGCFPDIRILDLHGSAKKREVAPDGEKDENVFDIQQGVAISLLVRPPSPAVNRVRHAELWGQRPSKYHSLDRSSAASTEWRIVESVAPHHFFVPKNFNLASEYHGAPSVTEMFRERNAGIQTKNDGFVYAMTRGVAEERIVDLRSGRADHIAQKYKLSLDGHWDIHAAKDDIRRNQGVFVQVLNKPFDKRWTYYTGKSSGFMARPRAPVMRSGLIPNRILLTVRNPRRGNTDSFFIADTIVDKDGVSPFDNATIFPLFLPPADGAQRALLAENRLNLSERFLTVLRETLNVREAVGGLPAGLTPEDIFYYAYAIFHSPSYRRRYAEFLKIDFPRLPLTPNLTLFRALHRLGGILGSLHLLESPTDVSSVVTYVGAGRRVVERVGWSNNIVWLNEPVSRKGRSAAPGTTGFMGVSEEVWNFHIGGYRVCERWLKDRKDQTLSTNDIQHYQKIVVAISETIRIMKEIDEAIEKHGGWPGAFLASANDANAEVRMAAEPPPPTYQDPS